MTLLTHSGAASDPREKARRTKALIELGVVVAAAVAQAWLDKRPRAAPAKAQSPWRLPLAAWKAILLKAWKEFQEDQIPAVSGSVAYSGIVAIFPALAAFVSLWGLFADVAEAGRQVRMLHGFVPPGVSRLLAEQMTRIAGARHGGLGLAFVAGLIISLWSANAGVKALFRGLNIAYEEKERRSFLQLNLTSLAFTLGGMVFLLCAAGSVMAAPVVLKAIRLDAFGEALAILRWPVLVALMVLALAVLYRFGPDRAQPKWTWVTPGSLLAALVWVVMSLVFSWYLSSMGSYEKTYGSLGAIFGFLTWIWLSSVIVLFGAEVNCEVERQTAGASGRPSKPPRK